MIFKAILQKYIPKLAKLSISFSLQDIHFYITLLGIKYEFATKQVNLIVIAHILFLSLMKISKFNRGFNCHFAHRVTKCTLCIQTAGLNSRLDF